MSTKSSIFYDEETDFHLYSDGFDSWNVHLDVPLGGGSEVTIVMPLRIWKEMRKTTMYMEKYLDMSPADLRTEAEEAVAKRLCEYKESDKSWAYKMMGCVTFGDIDLPAAEQVKHYIEWYTPPGESP